MNNKVTNREMSMSIDHSSLCDVAIIGGGPAGIFAALELSRMRNLNIHLFENERQLGGIPRSAHYFFGMRDLKRALSGKQYADRLSRKIEKTDVDIHTASTVVDLIPGTGGNYHQINVASETGYQKYECKYILLAMGCFESSREKRLIPGTRPAGIYTTGTLQKMVKLHRLKPGTEAVVVGTEHVSFSSVLSLKQAGVKIKGMVENDSSIHSYPWVGKSMSLIYRFPIYTETKIAEIVGAKRVEAVYLENSDKGKKEKVGCDTVIVTGKFMPESALLNDTGIELDSSTSGPVVDLNYQTSVQNIFAVGNVLRGANTHDRCALEGRRAGQMISKAVTRETRQEDVYTRLKAKYPIRYVAPQRLVPIGARKYKTSTFDPCVGIQVSRTLHRPMIQACSGDEVIWQKRLRKIIGNTNVAIQIEKFDWSRVDARKDIELSIVQ
jgi:thioredoxin reductase